MNIHFIQQKCDTNQRPQAHAQSRVTFWPTLPQFLHLQQTYNEFKLHVVAYSGISELNSEQILQQKLVGQAAEFKY